MTPAEKAFVAQEKPITYMYDPDWAPFEWQNGINEHVGMVADILKIIEQKSGLIFQAKHASTWSEAVDSLKHSKVDMISVMSISESRKKFTNFTENTLFSIPYVFVSRNGDDFSQGFSSLKDVKVAVIKNYTIEEIIKEDFPEMPYQTVSNMKEGFSKLLDGKIDVFILNQASAQYHIKMNAYNQLRVSHKTKYLLALHIALNKHYPKEALSIIDKTIALITKEQIRTIYEEWFYLPETSNDENTILLNEDEKLWIQEHPVIRFVGDPNWLPFEAFDENGKYIGIVAEYLKSIESVTGLTFQNLNAQTWEASVGLMQEKKADMISETTDSDMRSYLSFTKPYLENHIVIVMNQKATYIDNLSLIEDRKIAVIKGYGYVSKIQKAYPNIHFMEVENIHEGLKSVDSSKADALLCTMALGSYHIYKDGYVNLRIVGKTEFNTQLGFGVQPELEPLVGILNKAMLVLDNGKKQEILKKWTIQEYIEKIDYTLIWEILLASGALLSLFFFINRKMRREINQRIEVEKQLHLAHAQVKETNEQMQKSIEFSSMIQRALIPHEENFKNFFSAYFRVWKPRDTVGGDIYFFETLRHKDEALLVVIDCTGHGVPGAFVTMLVKAIERNMIGFIKKNEEEVSPAKLLSVLNSSMKHLLRQEDKSSESNAGLDAGILYINKKENVARFAGAETDLYYSHEGDIKRLKGNRQSIGYRNSKLDYEYTDYEISLEEGIRFYLSTDGYLDQNGGDKGFPMGRKKFQSILQNNQEKTLAEVEGILFDALAEYQGKYESNDDITVVGVSL